MKVVPAKCPTCGASIQVDKDADRTKCDYCDNYILIEDALKIRVEHTGTVKISGFKSTDDKIEESKKYAKLGDYEQAIEILGDVIENEPFNLEAIYLDLNYRYECYNGGYLFSVTNYYVKLNSTVSDYIAKLNEFDVNNEYSDIIRKIHEREVEIKNIKSEQNSKRRRLIIIFAILFGIMFILSVLFGE